MTRTSAIAIAWAVVLSLSLVLALALAPVAVAQPGVSAPERLATAAAAADSGDWPAVDRLAASVADDRRAATADRAEAYRLLGLAAYHQRHLDEAEARFLAYLQLDLEARLDPSLYAPELVGFFENVRATHAAELRALRPRPRRAVILNLIPPAGQFQNRQPVKGWILGGVGFALLATHLTTYVVLDRWCDDRDHTCEPDGQSRSDTARSLLTLNRWSGIALIGTYVYGVVDGLRHYRRTPSATFRTGVTVAPLVLPGGGPGVGFAGYF